MTWVEVFVPKTRKELGYPEIKEEGEEKEEDGSGEPGVSALSGEIDAFIHDSGVSIPEATLEKFATAVEQEIAQSENARDKWAADGKGELLLAAIARIAALASALAKNPEASSKYTSGAHRVTAVLHHAMAFLEDEFHALLAPFLGGELRIGLDDDAAGHAQPRRQRAARRQARPGVQAPVADPGAQLLLDLRAQPGRPRPALELDQ